MTDYKINSLINHRLTKHTLLIITLFFIAFISIWIRAFTGSMKDYSKAKELLTQEQYVRAVTYFDRAMHWYAPFNSYVDRSAESLWKISDRAEKAGDYFLARIAIESIRNSFYASRSFYTPGKRWIEKSEKRILKIIQDHDDRLFTNNNMDTKSPSAYKIETVYNDPDVFWTIVLESGLIGWIGAIIGFINFTVSKGIKPDTYIYKHWFWISITGFFYGIWILGMIKA